MNIYVPTFDLGHILQPGNVIAWIIIGLLAGGLAGLFTRGRGFGCLGNIIVGLIGAVIGGYIAQVLELGTFKFCGSLFISFIGACIFVFVLELITGGPRRRY